MSILADITGWPEAAVYIAAWGGAAAVLWAFCRYVIGNKQ